MSQLPSLIESSAGVIRRHAKSFHWASMIFSREMFFQVAALYHFCRYVDDWADEVSPEQGRAELEKIRAVIERRRDQPRELNDLVLKLTENGVDRAWMIDLLIGAESDLKSQAILSEDELLNYCYHVAGVVGLMMCPLIGVREARAYQNAVELGIAMQLTNIARDVAEDAQRGRVYLPANWLTEIGLTSQNVLENSWSREARQQVMNRLLNLADFYYGRGRLGLQYIPLRGRLAVAVAAAIYQRIGRSLRSQDLNPWLGRAYVNSLMKGLLTIQEIAVQFLFSMGRKFASGPRL